MKILLVELEDPVSDDFSNQTKKSHFQDFCPDD